MKSLFSVHHGEFLVGQEIEGRIPSAKIWVPGSRDEGIDLLVTDNKCRHAMSIQVKFSRDYPPTTSDPLSQMRETGGWWKFSGKKGRSAVDQIRTSAADFWILVSYNAIKRHPNFLILTPAELAAQYEALDRRGPIINSYLWVLPGTDDRTVCIEGRDLPSEEKQLIADGQYRPAAGRDWTRFLEHWERLGHKLELTVRPR